MSFLRPLQKRFGWMAVENLPLYIVAANAMVFFSELAFPGITPLLILDPEAVLTGDVWRLVTFLFVPPQTHPIFIFFWLYLIYLYGGALEEEWGSFPFTVFYIAGALAHAASAFLILKGPVSNVYLNLSLFLAFAVLFPNMELLLFFILPVKVKYLALLSWAWTLLFIALAPWPVRLSTLVNLGNYFLFFGPDHIRWLRLKWDVHRNRRRFRP